MSENDGMSSGPGSRTGLAKTVVAVLALSALGFVVSAVGHIAGWEGFDNGGESTRAGDTFWLLYFFGGVVGLVLGVVALIRSRRGEHRSERRAGVSAVVYVVVTIALIALIDAVFD